MLTNKAKNFYKIYASSQNGTQSAKDAGYSARSAHSTANRLLKDTEGIKYLTKEVDILRAKMDITNEDIIAGLSKIATDANEKASDRHACYKTLAQIKGMLKENITNVAVFSDIGKEDKTIISKRLRANSLEENSS